MIITAKPTPPYEMSVGLAGVPLRGPIYNSSRILRRPTRSISIAGWNFVTVAQKFAKHLGDLWVVNRLAGVIDQ